MKEILKLEHIQKFYGNQGNLTKAIHDISFSVNAGEFVGIMGASGSGKTTLLNCISTIDTASAGHIFLDETDVTEMKDKELARFRRENLGFVFQDFNLLDTLTISENIALALTINHTAAGQIPGRVKEIAEILNISDILEKYPYQVSGGQKQRCACAGNHQRSEAASGRRADRSARQSFLPVASRHDAAYQRAAWHNDPDGNTRRIFRQLCKPYSVLTGRRDIHGTSKRKRFPQRVL